MKTIILLISALAAQSAFGADPDINESDIFDGTNEENTILDSPGLDGYEERAEEESRDQIGHTNEKNIVLDNSRLVGYEDRAGEESRELIDYANEDNLILYELYDSRLKILEDSVEEVRRDQLNYAIEKDLLTKTYSSNLETVNTIITIILVIFAVLAFLGLLSISNLRSQLKFDVETFQNQRIELERRLAKVENKQ